jgi:hypothetical protein
VSSSVFIPIVSGLGGDYYGGDEKSRQCGDYEYLFVELSLNNRQSK